MSLLSGSYPTSAAAVVTKAPPLCAWDGRPPPTTQLGSPGGPARHPTPAGPSPSQLRRSLSPAPRVRLAGTPRMHDELNSGTLGSAATVSSSTGGVAGVSRPFVSKGSTNSTGGVAVAAERVASVAANASASAKAEATQAAHEVVQVQLQVVQELEATQVQLQTNRIEVEKVLERHEASAKQTEAALVEVCKNLGMQQEQLEQQEMCTGMIQKLLQDFLPGLLDKGINNSLALPEQDNAPSGLSAALRMSIEHISTQQEQLRLRTESVETLLGTLQNGVVSLQQQLSLGSLKSELALRSSGRSHGLNLPELPLADLCVEIPATSAGSSPTSNSKASHVDDVANHVLVPLRVELEILCREAHAGLEKSLREDMSALQSKQETLELATGGLREEREALLARLASTVREEVEVVRGDALASVMGCWQELQQQHQQQQQQPQEREQQADIVLDTLEARIQEVQQLFSKELQSFRQEVQDLLQRSFTYQESLEGRMQEVQGRMQEVRLDFCKELDTFRGEFQDSFQQSNQKLSDLQASSAESQKTCAELEAVGVRADSQRQAEIHIQYKEMCYLVNVQQKLLSKHAEELETLRIDHHEGLATLRLEQNEGLSSVASSTQQKLEAVLELSRGILHQNVDSVCSQAKPGPLALGNQMSADEQQPNPSSVIQVQVVSEKEPATVSRPATFSSHATGWPMLQRQLEELGKQVNDIEDASSQRPGSIEEVLGLLWDGFEEVPTASIDASSQRPGLLWDACDEESTTSVGLSPCVDNLSLDILDAVPSSPLGQDACLLMGGCHTPEAPQSARTEPQSVCTEPPALEIDSPKAAQSVRTESPIWEVTSPKAAGQAAAAESAALRQKLENLLQGLQEDDRSSLAAELGAIASQSGQARSSWWTELQEKHPELGHLVQTHSSELVRIVEPERTTLPTDSESQK